MTISIACANLPCCCSCVYNRPQAREIIAVIENILSEKIDPSHEEGPSSVNCASFEEVMDVHEETMTLIKARGTDRCIYSVCRCCLLTMCIVYSICRQAGQTSSKTGLHYSILSSSAL